jgi:hypothetical protein
VLNQFGGFVGSVAVATKGVVYLTCQVTKLNKVV